LKSRIFLSDRFEKIEKVLVTLGLISKDSNYCDQDQFNNFRQKFDFEIFIEELDKDNEDLWFEIYRSVCSDKRSVEMQIER